LGTGEDRRDLAELETLVLLEDEDLALLGRKVVERARHRAPPLLRRDALGRIVGRDGLERGLPVSAIVARAHDQAPPPLPPHLVAAQVERDLVHPRGEARAGLELVRLAQDPKEGLLA